MTDPRDPVDDWLGSDIELLNPPPGTFGRVSRLARRRRMMRAMTVAAGAIVIIAGVVTAPRLAATLLPGGNGAAKVAQGPDSPGAAGHSGLGQHATSPVPHFPARPASGPRPGTGLSDTSNPAPPGFRPTSVTFISPNAGAAIGQAGPPCPKISCTTVAGTFDYGRHWFGASALATSQGSGSRGVSQIRFLDSLNGWAFGPQLFATHDGGRSWTEITTLPPGRVVDLSTVGDRAFAVVATCTGTGTDYSADCTGFKLLSAMATSDHWLPVPGMSAAAPVSPGGLQLTGQRGYLLAHGVLYAGPVTGGGWQPVPNGSPATPPCLRPPRQPGWQPGSGLLAPAPSGLYLVCTSVPASSGPVPLGSLILDVSLDGGLTWQADGPIRAAGTATSLAAAPGGSIVLATSAGIYYSADASTWDPASLAGGPPARGFSFVGMTTTLRGVAVPVDSRLHEVFITLDGGRTWQPSVIR